MPCLWLVWGSGTQVISRLPIIKCKGKAMSQSDRQKRARQKAIEHSLREIRKINFILDGGLIAGEANYALNTENFPFVSIVFHFSPTRRAILKAYLHVESTRENLDGLEVQLNIHAIIYKQSAQEDYVSKSQDVLRKVSNKNSIQLRKIARTVLLDKISSLSDKFIGV